MSTNLDRLGDGVRDALDAVIAHRRDTNDRDQGHFHPSTVGDCPRKITLERLKIPKEPHSVRVQRIFENGHSAHERIQAELAEAGVQIRDEVPVRMTDRNCKGHTDGIGLLYFAEFGGVSFILEIKSAGDKSFKRMRDGDRWNPPGVGKKYAWQVQLYMWMTGFMYTVFVIENKNDQDRLYITLKRDDDLIKTKMLPKIDLVNTHVEAKTLPPRDRKEYPNGCFDCRYCDYAKVCAKEDELRADSTELIDLTKLGAMLL